MAKYEFAIKKDVLNSGKVILTPVVRRRSILGRFNIFPNPWERITRIYDHYTTMELSFIPELSYRECEEHIKAYQTRLMESKDNEVAEIEYDNLEEKDY